MKTITVKHFRKRDNALGEALVNLLLALPVVLWTVLVCTVKILLCPVVVLLAFLGIDLTGTLYRTGEWD